MSTPYARSSISHANPVALSGISSTGAVAPQRSSLSPKRNVACEPLSPGRFAQTALLSACQSYMQIDPKLKAAYYATICVIISCISDIIRPVTYLSSTKKGSLLNQYFIKLGWGWTFFACIPIMVMCTFIASAGRVRHVLVNLVRLVIGSILWYICTNLFLIVERRSGYCTDEVFSERGTCTAAGNRWLALDISGHTFLIVFCSLILLEESQLYTEWLRQGRRVQTYGRQPDDQIFDRSLPASMRRDERAEAEKIFYRLKLLYDRSHAFVTFNFVLFSAMALLFDVSFIITLIYYHNVIQKVLGVVVAIGAWWMMYKVVLFRLSFTPAHLSSLSSH